MKNLNTLIIATRESTLALWQANFVKIKLEHLYPNKTFHLLKITSSGDKHKDASLAEIGGKMLFAKELQHAVQNGDAHFAVHSLKDLGAQCPEGLTLAAICERDDPRDAFISNQYTTFSALPAGAIVGTSSPRRQCQLLALNPDLKVKLLRGNVQTRLAKLSQGNYDAIILAAAGLARLNLSHVVREYLSPEQFIPAIGQGAIALECKKDNYALQELLAPLNHQKTELCTRAERAVNARLGGSCFSPIAAYATLENNTLSLDAMVGALDGSKILNVNLTGDPTSAQTLGLQAAEQLIKQGAADLLQSH